MRLLGLLGSCRFVLLFSLSFSLPWRAHAAIISSCNQAGLEAALAAGGDYTFSCSGTIILTNTLTVTSDVSFDGAGQQVIISGNGTVRMFKVQPGVHLTLANLTLANGNQTGTNGTPGSAIPQVPTTPGEPVYGGAILINSALVTLISCVISNNSIKGGNGAIGPTPTQGGTAHGGAIYNSGGTLTAVNCLFTRNQVTGGVPADGVNPISPPDSFGGAICSSNGMLNLSSNIFTLNTNLGTTVNFVSVWHTAGNAFGGALHCEGGSNYITHCSFSLNYALGGGSTPTGATGAGNGGAWSVTNSVVVASTCLFNTNDAAAGSGSRSGGPETRGGAIYNQGDISFTDCSLKGNTARGSANQNHGGHAKGGAIYNAGRFAMIRSLVLENVALGGGAFARLQDFTSIAGNGMGGAIYNTGTFVTTNSTWFQNRAVGNQAIPYFPNGAATGGSGLGGMLFNDGGTSIVASVTISENKTEGGKGNPSGLALGNAFFSTNGAVNVHNSILANSGSGSNCFGTLLDNGYNLSSDSSCNFSATGSLNNTDLLLGPLQDNGGSTLSRALTDCSPGVDAGDPSVFPSDDQRGVLRPVGPRSDIGAVEGIVTWYHSIVSVSNDAVELKIIGRPNEPFTVSKSSDCASWSLLLSDILGANCSYLYTTTNESQAFFKVRFSISLH